MTLTFNQFQKELRQMNVDGKTAYFLTMIYERLIDTENQLMTCARLVESMADSMQGFVELNEAQQREMRKVLRGGRPDGIEVESVAIKPEED
jgi:hypothetical protein